jgi:hypothetical protein
MFELFGVSVIANSFCPTMVNGVDVESVGEAITDTFGTLWME